jgi:hypothetical protein
MTLDPDVEVYSVKRSEAVTVLILPIRQGVLWQRPPDGSRHGEGEHRQT